MKPQCQQLRSSSHFRLPRTFGSRAPNNADKSPVCEDPCGCNGNMFCKFVNDFSLERPLPGPFRYKHDDATMSATRSCRHVCPLAHESHTSACETEFPILRVRPHRVGIRIVLDGDASQSMSHSFTQDLQEGTHGFQLLAVPLRNTLVKFL